MKYKGFVFLFYFIIKTLHTVAENPCESTHDIRFSVVDRDGNELNICSTLSKSQEDTSELLDTINTVKIYTPPSNENSFFYVKPTSASVIVWYIVGISLAYIVITIPIIGIVIWRERRRVPPASTEATAQILPNQPYPKTRTTPDYENGEANIFTPNANPLAPNRQQQQQPNIQTNYHMDNDPVQSQLANPFSNILIYRGNAPETVTNTGNQHHVLDTSKLYKY